MANKMLPPPVVIDVAGPKAVYINDGSTNNYSAEKRNGFNLRALFQRRNSTGQVTTSSYQHIDFNYSNNPNDRLEQSDRGIGMGGDIQAVISARRAAMATAAAGYYFNSTQNEHNHRDRDDPLRMSQLERDLYNVASGKSSGCSIVAAKRRASISSFVSAVSLPEELRDGCVAFGEEYGDSGSWEECDYQEDEVEDGYEENHEWNEDNGDDVIYDRNYERTLKSHMVSMSGRQSDINGDIHNSNDQHIKNLKSSAIKTNQEAIETIIDLKMRLAHESSSKDELAMKLKHIADEKTEIERILAEMIREKQRLDGLFNERNELKKKGHLQQQQQPGQGNGNESKIGGRSSKRASWCAAIPNTSTSNGRTTHFSSNTTKLTALVSELDNSISLRDLMDDKVSTNAEACKIKPSHDKRGSGLDPSIKSFGTRRHSSFFSGSLSALFSEAAVCPSDNKGKCDGSDIKIVANDAKGDTSQSNSLYSNNSSLSNISRVIHSKLFSSIATTAATSITTATAKNNDTPGIPKALASKDIMSLVEENTKLLRDNANISSENLQLKSDLEFLKKAFENLLQTNNLITTSTGNPSVDSRVMDMLYNRKDKWDYEEDLKSSGKKNTLNSTVDRASSNKQTISLSPKTGFRRGCIIDLQTHTPSSTKSKSLPPSQDRSARDADSKLRFCNSFAGNSITGSNDYIDQEDVDSVISEYSSGESSKSIGDDTIQRELREVNKKFSSLSASVRQSANPMSTTTRRSSLPSLASVNAFCGSNYIANEEAEVGAILNETGIPTEDQRRLRTRAKRNNSLPRSAFSSQQPSYMKSLSFRRNTPAISNSITLSAETGQESSRMRNICHSNDSSESPKRRFSTGLRRHSSILLLQEAIDIDEGMNFHGCDDDESWVSNGNGVMVKINHEMME